MKSFDLPENYYYISNNVAYNGIQSHKYTIDPTKFLNDLLLKINLVLELLYSRKNILQIMKIQKNMQSKANMSCKLDFNG